MNFAPTVLLDKTLHTTEDFRAFVRRAQEAGDDRIYELVHGEVTAKMVTLRHGAIAFNVLLALGNYVKPRKLGQVYPEVNYYTPGDLYNDRIPDVSFVSAARNLPMTDKGSAPFMPDLAVEVKSDGNTYKELREKAEYFLNNGSRLVWLIYPDRLQVESCTLNEDRYLRIEVHDIGGTLSGGDILPDFTLPVRDIFDVETSENLPDIN